MSADFGTRVVGQRLIDPLQQVAHLFTGGAAGRRFITVFLAVKHLVGNVQAAITAIRSAPITLPLLRISRILPSR